MLELKHLGSVSQVAFKIAQYALYRTVWVGEEDLPEGIEMLELIEFVNSSQKRVTADQLEDGTGLFSSSEVVYFFEEENRKINFSLYVNDVTACSYWFLTKQELIEDAQLEGEDYSLTQLAIKYCNDRNR